MAMTQKLISELDNEELPEKVNYAIRHLLAMADHKNERLCRLNTALELLESHKKDMENRRASSRTPHGTPPQLIK